ncbi:MAG: FtsX-like permease family protein [Acidobacteria bacterium]|nr:FtsX-like permease family protein [Acidobacteriota bacterium]
MAHFGSVWLTLAHFLNKNPHCSLLTAHCSLLTAHCSLLAPYTVGMLPDLRLALRSLLKTPGYALVIVATLALGIGANTAIFSLFNQVVLRLLPVKDPQQLVLFHSSKGSPGWSTSDNSQTVYSYPIYRDFAAAGVFQDVLARSAAAVSLAYGGRSERASAELVSGNFFPSLGVAAVRGRALGPADDQVEGGHPVVVLGYGYWQRQFGGDEAVLNQALTVNGRAMTVVGVAPPDFHGVMTGRDPDLFAPLAMWRELRPELADSTEPDRLKHWLNILARLAPQTTLQQAQAAVGPVYRAQLEEEVAQLASHIGDRDRFVGRSLQLVPAVQGISSLRDQIETPLNLLLAMAGAVLLISCVNVAGLMLARAMARRRETAIRLALGAARWRIARGLFLESLWLTAFGTAAGLLIAHATLTGLLSIPPASDWAGLDARLDGRVLAFALTLAALTALLCGLLPAVQAWRTSFAAALKDQSAGGGEAPRATAFRKAIVVSQVALSMLLLVSAGLFARSLYNLRTFDPGFRSENLLTFSIDPALNGYSPERGRQLNDELLRRLRALPGVADAASSAVAVLTNMNMSSNITVEGYQPAPDESVGSGKNIVSPGFFQTLGIPVLEGRGFNERDTADSPNVAVVNQAFVQRYFGEGDAVGKRFAFGGGDNIKLDVEIVGVAGNQKSAGLREQYKPFLYTPSAQSGQLMRSAFYVRTALDEASLAPTVRELVRGLDPELPLFEMKSVELVLEESIALDRLVAGLAVAFAALATVLATLGLFGLMAYNVTRRRREIGVRMALGASHQNVTGLIVRQACAYLAIGLAVGTLAAGAAARYAESELFGVTAHDAAVYAGAAAFLAAAGLLAAALPARQAGRVDPMEALRHE